MKVQFKKYQGTGNDFIIVDNRSKLYTFTTEQIQAMCSRKVGIGSDGFMLIEEDSELNFKMRYFNADGLESTLCGNGGRCVAACAYEEGFLEHKDTFNAVDGKHEVSFEGNEVSLKMNDLSAYEKVENGYFLNTGSPHYVSFVKDIKHLDIITDAHKVRYSKTFEGSGGTNVNFVMETPTSDTFAVRTYERGVEDETLSCGTGAVACALTAFISGKTNSNIIKLQTQGGILTVKFDYSEGKFSNIWLKGRALHVFDGEIEI